MKLELKDIKKQAEDISEITYQENSYEKSISDINELVQDMQGKKMIPQQQ
jgi:hypothetical protein